MPQYLLSEPMTRSRKLMAKTDQPFKRLITLIGREFAAWVLNMDVRSETAVQ